MDFYDIWMCSKHLDFELDRLLKAVRATFESRKTPASPDEFAALLEGFAKRHRAQRNAFVRKIGEGELRDSFDRVIEDLLDFASPILHALAPGEKAVGHWHAGKGWVS